MTVALDAPVVPFAPPCLDERSIAEVVRVLESGWLSTGPRTRDFEAAFARYTGARHAVALNSCTAGLHLSLLASGIGPGDEVITSPLTFCASANVIVHAGATPVFADIDPHTGTLDPEALESAVTPRTRGVIPVHYSGLPADMGAIGRVARRHDLVVIEDAAHCIEGVAAGRKIGAISDFTCFSFYATKNLTTGEGGMVTTSSETAAEYVRTASLHGMTRTAWSRYQPGGGHAYDVVLPGFKYNMSDLQAALGLHQLAALERHYARRCEIWDRYDDAIADLPVARFADPPPGTRHARHLYTILIDGRAGVTRDSVARLLGEAGVASSVHFPPVHLHRYYRETYGCTRGQLPHAERIADSVLSLPLSAALSDEQIDRVIDVLRRAFGVHA